MDWPVTQPTGDEAIVLGGVVTTAAVDIAAPAGAVSRRLEVAKPDRATAAGESPAPPGARPTADSTRETACAGLGFAAALAAFAFGAAASGAGSEAATVGAGLPEPPVTLRAETLFDVRGEDPVDFGFAGEDDPVPADFDVDELCDDEPESPEPDVSAHATPAPERIATPTPRPTAKPPMRPTYAEAFFVGPIIAPLVLQQTVPHLANLIAHSDHDSANKFGGQRAPRNAPAAVITTPSAERRRTAVGQGSRHEETPPPPRMIAKSPDPWNDPVLEQAFRPI